MSEILFFTKPSTVFIKMNNYKMKYNFRIIKFNIVDAHRDPMKGIYLSQGRNAIQRGYAATLVGAHDHLFIDAIY